MNAAAIATTSATSALSASHTLQHRPGNHQMPPRLACLVLVIGLVLLSLLLTGCGGGGGGTAAATSNATPPPATETSPGGSVVTATPTSSVLLSELGQKIFADKSLSASGKMACVSCHNPDFGHASNPALGATVSGGVDGLQPGLRNVPSVGYLRFAPSLRVNVSEQEIAGGFNWDGSANSFQEQAQRPFLSSHEMANLSADSFAEKLKATPYAAQFETFFGMSILANGAKTLEAAGAAVGEFLTVSPVFAPLDSKFDAVQAGKAVYTATEARGLAWFTNPAKGNCASCHMTTGSAPDMPAMFTDFGYDNLGVPRNNLIAANSNPSRFDLGLCEHPLGKTIDLSSTCGAFKAPSLRNVAKTAPYFHNGKFETLREVLEFYVTRDITPGRWYPSVAGVVNQYDDVPAQYKSNVNTQIAPYDRKPGDTPALTADEITDVLAFLGTLSDGWKAPAAAATAAARPPH